MSSRNWTYVRLLLPTVEALDRAVVAIGASAEFALVRRETPWFFLRYVDFYGPQLRLRVLAEPGRRLCFVEWSRCFYRSLIAELERQGAATPGGPVPGRVGFDVAPYRPEITKYGSLACVERVEDLWVGQCEQVLQYWTPPIGKSARIASFAAVAFDVMEQLNTGVSDASPYRTHAWYWLRTMNPVQDVAQRFIGQVQLSLDGPHGERRPSPGSLADDVVRSIAELRALPGARSVAHYAFNLLHILANRLGLAPIEEGLVMLALAARVDQEIGSNRARCEEVTV